MLSSDERLRYKRQLIMHDVGEEGQLKLRKTKVLVIGAGGLGSPVLFYLTAMGIGTIGIVDSDNVDLSNLQRQILHDTNKIGVNKVKSAKESLERLNPHINLVEYPFRITKNNCVPLISDYDIIVTALDNLTTRYLVNETCVSLRKPLVEAGVAGWEGLATTIIPGKSPCYRCIFPTMPEENEGEIGLIGCLPGVLGTIQAMEVVKLVLKLGNTLTNRLLVFDGLELTFSEFKMERNMNCPVCGNI
ncbi:MAG: adenylyltransferase [Desulfitibacter sp. BRH_c19]|nr:MAG: adenylyltransferase [Desulfitibacter sp. BRH_c19]